MSELLEKAEIARKQLKDAIDWNFGIVGSCPIANKKQEKVWELEAELAEAEPVNWKKYQDKYY